jgi:hypothetical protein
LLGNALHAEIADVVGGHGSVAHGRQGVVDGGPGVLAVPVREKKVQWRLKYEMGTKTTQYLDKVIMAVLIAVCSRVFADGSWDMKQYLLKCK